MGGIAYYSHHDVVYLDGADQIRDFLARGGRVLVLKADKVGRIEQVTSVEIHARLREGDRSWLVVSPASGAAPERRTREALVIGES